MQRVSASQQQILILCPIRLLWDIEVAELPSKVEEARANVSNRHLVLSLNVAISVKDYVQFGLRGSQNFGIEGYALATTCALDKPLITKIHAGKRNTYIDEEVKAKKGIPPAQYKIMGDLKDTRHKSRLDRAPRTTMADEIAAF